MDPAVKLDGFIDKFRPELAAAARAMLARLRTRIPGATLLVYDNYNALAIGFSASDKLATVVISLALYPRWVSLFFANGAALADPKGLLAGAGKRVRHIRLTGPDHLDDPGVAALIATALAAAKTPIDPAAPARLIIKSVSAKQRPRR